MKAIDTNVLIRFLTGDNPVAQERVLAMFRSAQEQGEMFLVTNPVLIEVLWVLRSGYSLDRDKILDAFEALLDAPVLAFESTRHLRQFIQHGRSTNFGLADLLIGITARQHGCETTLTFDKKAAQFDLFEEIP